MDRKILICGVGAGSGLLGYHEALLHTLAEEHKVKIVSFDEIEEDYIIPYRNMRPDVPPPIITLADVNFYDKDRSLLFNSKSSHRMFAVDSLSKQRKKAKAARRANKQRRKNK